MTLRQGLIEGCFAICASLNFGLAHAACSIEQTASNELRITGSSDNCSSSIANGQFKERLQEAVAAMNAEACDCAGSASHSAKPIDQRSPRQQALWNMALAKAAAHSTQIRMPGIAN